MKNVVLLNTPRKNLYKLKNCGLDLYHPLLYYNKKH